MILAKEGNTEFLYSNNSVFVDNGKTFTLYTNSLQDFFKKAKKMNLKLSKNAFTLLGGYVKMATCLVLLIFFTISIIPFWILEEAEKRNMKFVGWGKKSK